MLYFMHCTVIHVREPLWETMATCISHSNLQSKYYVKGSLFDYMYMHNEYDYKLMPADFNSLNVLHVCTCKY